MSQSPHDAIVKYAFSNPKDAAAELKVALPAELARQIDWTTLAVEQGSFVERALEKSHSDILYSANLAGESAYLYVLFEHKSYTDTLLPLSLARYVLRVLDMHVKRFGPRLPLPPVVAVVFYHTKEGWHGSAELLSLFGDLPERVLGLREYLPQLRFRIDDISHLSDDALLGRGSADFLTLVLWVLRDGRARRKILETIKRFGHLLDRLAQDPAQRDALAVIFRYIELVVAGVTPEELHQAIIESAPMTESTEMTIAEILHQRGFEKGLEKGEATGRLEGRHEGRLEGQAAILARQLVIKFGRVPSWTEERLRKATTTELENWAERVLFADSAESVFGE